MNQLKIGKFIAECRKSKNLTQIQLADKLLITDAVKLEVSVGAYKCKKCGNEFIPTYHDAIWAMHRGTTRYLKCPNCNKKSWCKKILK